MKEFETTITWHVGEKPPKSGCYLCMLIFGDFVDIHALHYSDRHKTFNVQDEYDEKKVNRLKIETVYAWAEMLKSDCAVDLLKCKNGKGI